MAACTGSPAAGCTGITPPVLSVPYDTVRCVSVSAQMPYAIAAAPLGCVIGVGGRLLLARLGRGVVVSAGPVEAACAVVWCGSVLLCWSTSYLPAALWLGTLLVVLSAVDIAAHRLPYALTYPAIGLSLLLIVITRWCWPVSGSVPTALAAAGIGTAIALGAHLATPTGLGLGDVKLLPSLLLVTGYRGAATALLALVIAVVGAGLVATVMVVLRRWRRSTSIAFGPYLLAGAWAVTAAPALVDAVLGR